MVHFFGRFMYLVNGEEVEFRNKKAKELLAFLLVHQGKRVNKAYISECLWPETMEYSGRDSLYKAYSYLKKLNLPICSVRNEMWVELKESMCVDFITFDNCYKNKLDIEMCKNVIEIYRRPFLSEESYEWSTIYASYYEIKYLEVIEILIGYYEKNNNNKMVLYYKKILEM